ncbi:MAG: DUF1501 domain-containing protein [Planctomycetales bacterium]|nr:DUF1501 domain-containing protein [Planctomycetales bacterium]
MIRLANERTPVGHAPLLSRREMLRRASGGFLGTALSSLLVADDRRGAVCQSSELDEHHQLRRSVKSVIYLFMCGGVSQIDTFDPKDNRWAGKLIDAVGFGDNQAKMQRPVIPCHRTFKRYGESGIPVSDWFPHVGGVVDELAIVRSMYCHEVNHFPAVIEMATGHRRRVFEHPCLGSWVSHALGSENDNLPAFVNLGRPSSPIQLTGGYLGAVHAATPFQDGVAPIPNLKLPDDVSRTERDRQVALLSQLNADFERDYALDDAIAARVRAYELAGRMQLAAPEIVDLSRESRHTRDLYGIDQEPTNSFGRKLLLARRLVENGVRFIQICHAGGGNGGWDAHGDIETHAPLCRQVDQPIAALIADLKQRGLLDETLVVWTSEFGRTPWSQNDTGRDHNPRGFTSWLSGGSVQGGIVHGATDEVGYRAVEEPHYIADLQATILNQLGLDAHDMEIQLRGQPLKLVEDQAEPIWGVLRDRA